MQIWFPNCWKFKDLTLSPKRKIKINKDQIQREYFLLKYKHDKSIIYLEMMSKLNLTHIWLKHRIFPTAAIGFQRDCKERQKQR